MYERQIHIYLMKKYAFRIFIFCAFYVLLCFSCKGPLEWNNDIPGFVENGLSTITIRNSVNNADGIEITWLSSLEETVIRINLINPQNHEAEFTMTPTDAALYDSVPLMEVLDNRTLLLTIDPALSAEHGTLDFGLNIYIPSLNRNCPEQLVSFPCDTAPNPVDVVLGGTTDNDKAMTAFRLPASETDDDLVSIEVTWGVAGSTQTVTDTYSIADSGLLDPPADGENLLAGESDLNRYFYPAAAVTGSVYAFTVVLVDNAGRRSVARTATSDIVEYTIIYDSNGADSGNVPAMSTYVFGTQAIISANSGNLGSSGYFFDDWNTSPDGSGEAYTSGQTVTMDAGSLVLYAQWDNYHVVYHSDTGVGGGVVPEETDGYLSGDQATILGYADSGSGVDNLDDHHLLGWDTDIAAHTIVYEPGEVITMPESDVDLY
ncbi:MAG: InlB B-repeat-containing protein, partial [Spirochaetales bacterium]|nr:InlB B-repeat-containing protein [Spirochaetales bacterium]